jgi:hypothetical protein
MPSFFAPSRVNDEAARYTLTIDSQGCSGSAKQHGGGKNPGCAFTSGGASREITACIRRDGRDLRPGSRPTRGGTPLK